MRSTRYHILPALDMYCAESPQPPTAAGKELDYLQYSMIYQCMICARRETVLMFPDRVVGFDHLKHYPPRPVCLHTRVISMPSTRGGESPRRADAPVCDSAYPRPGQDW